jgi:major type 1 subunit fimbrin (pilin)
MTTRLTSLSLLASALALGSTFAHAADGTIAFEGKLIAAACTVDNSSTNMKVDMGSVSTTAFKAVGDTTSPKSFQLKLTNCDFGLTDPDDPDSAPKVGKATVRFDGTTTTEDPSLLAVVGGAQGVGIELADATGARVPVASDSPGMTLTKGENVLNFRARYIQTQDAVTAGAANSTAQFTLNYQ